MEAYLTNAEELKRKGREGKQAIMQHFLSIEAGDSGLERSMSESFTRWWSSKDLEYLAAKTQKDAVKTWLLLDEVERAGPDALWLLMDHEQQQKLKRELSADQLAAVQSLEKTIIDRAEQRYTYLTEKHGQVTYTDEGMKRKIIPVYGSFAITRVPTSGEGIEMLGWDEQLHGAMQAGEGHRFLLRELNESVESAGPQGEEIATWETMQDQKLRTIAAAVPPEKIKTEDYASFFTQEEQAAGVSLQDKIAQLDRGEEGTGERPPVPVLEKFEKLEALYAADRRQLEALYASAMTYIYQP